MTIVCENVTIRLKNKKPIRIALFRTVGIISMIIRRLRKKNRTQLLASDRAGVPHRVCERELCLADPPFIVI